MKIESMTIDHFKTFDHLEVSFWNAALEKVSDRFLILGDNGRGKTTLLQAVALPLALATYQIRDINDFNWPGFMPERYYSRKGTPKIQMWVTFEPEELEATRKAALLWKATRPATAEERNFILPGKEARLKLTLEADFLLIENEAGQRNPSFNYQFLGRYYVQKLLARGKGGRDLFGELPGMFWFDQSRNLANTRSETESGSRGAGGVSGLRQYLIEWSHKKQKGYKNAYLDQMEALYTRLFGNRAFSGLELVPNLKAPMEDKTLFMLNDGNADYELEEMSAGEQSIFPMLYQMVRLQIAHSVVLIDEVDLNLHPPLARTLVRDLFAIVPDCQFILTTHSETVSSLIGESHIYRLKGGNLCL